MVRFLNIVDRMIPLLASTFIKLYHLMALLDFVQQIDFYLLGIYCSLLFVTSTWFLVKRLVLKIWRLFLHSVPLNCFFCYWYYLFFFIYFFFHSNSPSQFLNHNFILLISYFIYCFNYYIEIIRKINQCMSSELHVLLLSLLSQLLGLFMQHSTSAWRHLVYDS